MHKRLKILLVGPKRGGKTMLSNMLALGQDTPSQSYRPTVGCRIHKFDKELKGPQGTTKLVIELWDVSGDPKYEKCWPAIQMNANGIIFVYDSTGTTSAADLDYWVGEFPRKMKLNPQFCIAFANKQNPESKTKAAQVKGVNNIECSLENVQAVHISFDKYLQGLASSITQVQELP